MPKVEMNILETNREIESLRIEPEDITTKMNEHFKTATYNS